MKPAPQINSNPPPDNRASTDHRNFPLTDYSYQATAEAIANPTALAQNRTQMPQARSLWKLSGDYFGAEAGLDFVTEAIFFAWISGVAAWPLSVMIYQLTRWMI
jgi:hypothetical protein